MDTEAAKFMAAGLSMGIGAIGSGIGEGFIGRKALIAMGRNPQMADKIFSNMIVACAVCESTGIYSLVIALILLFVA